MSKMVKSGSAFAVAMLFFLTGCPDLSSETRLNDQSESCEKEPYPLAETFAYHNDQGMMADMCIADIHFVPHSDKLSVVGERRLSRYAELLAGTGGTLAYDTSLRDRPLLDARLNTAREYLSHCTPGDKTIVVAVGLPGGRGLNNKEAQGGQDVAKQAETRGNAYKLGKGMDTTASGGGN